jgi:hypothetical protein
MVFARCCHIAMILAMTALAVLAIASGTALSQTKVRTETIRPPGAPTPQTPAEKPAADTQAKPSAKPAAPPNATPPEITTDLSRLPQPVAKMRERILAAAKSGELKKLVTAMQTNETMPIFSLGEEKDPVAFWKKTYPDSDGLEVLAILIGILEAPYVHVEKGTTQEMYLWPYFARMPLKALTPEQKVELFRIVTGADYKDMLDFGAYSFYRLGIGPDGTWHFFVSGD